MDELKQNPAENVSERTAIVVHEWFESVGGSEQVVNEILKVLPNSVLYCLWKARDVQIPLSRKVVQSWLSRTPMKSSKSMSLPLMPLVWRWSRLETERVDAVLVSSHLFAHHVRVPSGVPKLVYVHTPARYLWEPDLDHRGQSRIVRLAARILKPLDKYRAQEARALASNSEFVRQRVLRTWNRDSTVIYPPVAVSDIREVMDWKKCVTGPERDFLNSLPDVYLLGASRFIPYKRLDQVIRAGELSGLPVVLAGGGPLEGELRRIAEQASIPVFFAVRPSTPLLRAMYQGSAAFVFPAIEDFGIMPVEAIAAGTAVAANRVGGASESVIDGITGSHFDLDDDDSLLSAVQTAIGLKGSAITEHAEKFSVERFADQITKWMDSSLSESGPSNSASHL